jgi:hypothetical protein
VAVQSRSCSSVACNSSRGSGGSGNVAAAALEVVMAVVAEAGVAVIAVSGHDVAVAAKSDCNSGRVSGRRNSPALATR